MIKKPLVLDEGRTQQLQPADEVDTSGFSYEQTRERLFRRLLLLCATQLDIDDPLLEEELDIAIKEYS